MYITNKGWTKWMLLQFTKFISKYCTHMARQTGPVYYTGTIGPITYYKLFGEHYYLRTKSSLTKKRFEKDPAFARSRQRSKEFGYAVQLASEINRKLPKARRGKGFMGKLIGQVHKALLSGKNAAIV